MFGPEPSDFGINYKEIADLDKLRTSRGSVGNIKKEREKNMDVNVLECWLNDTLKEAEANDVPGTIKRINKGAGPSGGGKQSHCIEYGIDRLTLNNTGISNPTINKLYRCMFVNTMGFFD